MPEVSIVIPFYNCNYVQHAIQSALNQTYRDIEIIVVDDGSTSEYSKKVEPYLDSIHYIKKGNGGTASALNTGIKKAKGRYFTWLSSDDLYHPKKVGMQLGFMKAKSLAASYTSYHLIDHNHTIISKNHGIHVPTRKAFCQRMMKGNIINGCTVMLKMSVFDEVGTFDPSLLFTQDYDLWLRILPRYHFEYLNSPLVSYRVHEEMGTKKHQPRIQQEILQVQNKYRGSIEELIRKLG